MPSWDWLCEAAIVRSRGVKQCMELSTHMVQFRENSNLTHDFFLPIKQSKVGIFPCLAWLFGCIVLCQLLYSCINIHNFACRLPCRQEFFPQIYFAVLAFAKYPVWNCVAILEVLGANEKWILRSTAVHTCRSPNWVWVREVVWKIGCWNRKRQNGLISTISPSLRRCPILSRPIIPMHSSLT